MTPRPLLARVLAPLTLVVVGTGLALAYREPIAAWWAARTVVAPPPYTEPGPEALGQALRIAGVDSTRREEWVDAVPGLDTRALTPGQRDAFVRTANTRHCPCGCGFTLAACRAFDPSCEESLPLVTALFDSVAAGQLALDPTSRARPAR
jgi:hypothetical protein